MVDLRQFRRELQQELKDILAYWQRHAPDPVHGGFYGQVGYDNQPDTTAAKAIVLNSRILWTFSAAYRHTQHHEYRPTADRAYTVLANQFRDTHYGGVYWSITPDGKPLDTTKQLYGQAFALYGLSEYVRISHRADALGFAQSVFETMVKHSYDPAQGGFREAFARDWSATDQYALSRPANQETKTMNTNLHILEAFANFYRTLTDPDLRTDLALTATVKTHLRGMVDVFINHIVDPVTYRMNLFMDDAWQVRRTAISYGHDIEASWLLVEAADLLADPALIKTVRALSLNMARAAAVALQPDGGMDYELDPQTGHLNHERSWWVMAEAMVGFCNAYQLSHDQEFLNKAVQCWTFIKTYLLDRSGGEWFSGVDANHRVLGNAKISAWKCPYHNSRACMEASIMSE